MTITNLFEHRGGPTVPEADSPQLITLPDRFDIHQVPAFRAALNDTVESGADVVFIDARNVMHVDFAGILALLDAVDRAAVSSVRLRVISSTTLRIAFELVLDINDASGLFDNEILGQAA